MCQTSTLPLDHCEFWCLWIFEVQADYFLCSMGNMPDLRIMNDKFSTWCHASTFLDVASCNKLVEFQDIFHVAWMRILKANYPKTILCDVPLDLLSRAVAILWHMLRR